VRRLEEVKKNYNLLLKSKKKGKNKRRLGINIVPSNKINLL
jgi:hypothetical protein